MDSAPHRRDPAAVLTPDFDATDAEPDAAYPRVSSVTDDPGEATWRGDEWRGNQFAEAAWLDAAGPGEGGRRSVSVGYDGGCIGLWRAVVWQAFLDATAFGNEEIPDWARPKVGEPARRAARAWLLGGSQNFDEVCHFAQVDPAAIRTRARTLERQGWELADTGQLPSLEETV